MNSLFSKVASGLKVSPLREYRKKLAKYPLNYSFAWADPAPDALPSEDIKNILSNIVIALPPDALHYGMTAGRKELRELTVDILAELDISSNYENIFLTNGSQRAIDLLSTLLLDPGDIVLVENPSYGGAISCFKNHSAEIACVDRANGGLDINRMEDICNSLRSAGKSIKFFYCISTFHNPTGNSLEPCQRQQLARLAEKYNFIILEDDIYADLWFNTPFKPVSSYTKTHAVYLKSYSKIVAPGLRTAFVNGPAEIIQKVEGLAQTTDLTSGSLDQKIIFELVKSGILNRGLDKAREVYARNWQIFSNALQALPDTISWQNPEGGFFAWLKLPHGLNSEKLLQKCLERGMAFLPGNLFSPINSCSEYARFSFARMDEESAERGITILKESLNELIDE